MWTQIAVERSILIFYDQNRKKNVRNNILIGIISLYAKKCGNIYEHSIMLLNVYDTKKKNTNKHVN